MRLEAPIFPAFLLVRRGANVPIFISNLIWRRTGIPYAQLTVLVCELNKSQSKDRGKEVWISPPKNIRSLVISG